MLVAQLRVRAAVPGAMSIQALSLLTQMFSRFVRKLACALGVASAFAAGASRSSA
jgi:hypothetical protein